MLLAGGSRYLLLSSLLYASGSLLFWAWQRQRGTRFGRSDQMVLALLCAMALLAMLGFTRGWLRL
jgi:arginine:ornithine antiporter/lysine permease